ncbi:MAG: hypothetical protein WBC51_00480, partial [Vicinamibacterales bacterium]
RNSLRSVRMPHSALARRSRLSAAAARVALSLRAVALALVTGRTASPLGLPYTRARGGGFS